MSKIYFSYKVFKGFNKDFQNRHGWSPKHFCAPKIDYSNDGFTGREIDHVAFKPQVANQCCGNFPNRFPYSTKQGTRGCCDGRTFNR